MARSVAFLVSLLFVSFVFSENPRYPPCNCQNKADCQPVESWNKEDREVRCVLLTLGIRIFYGWYINRHSFTRANDCEDKSLDLTFHSWAKKYPNFLMIKAPGGVGRALVRGVPQGAQDPYPFTDKRQHILHCWQNYMLSELTEIDLHS